MYSNGNDYIGLNVQLMYRKNLGKKQVGEENLSGGSTDICHNPEVRNIFERRKPALTPGLTSWLLDLFLFQNSMWMPRLQFPNYSLHPQFNSLWWDFTDNTMTTLKIQRERGINHNFIVGGFWEKVSLCSLGLHWTYNSLIQPLYEDLDMSLHIKLIQCFFKRQCSC